MSADEFGKNQGESDIEQLTRIVEKLEKAFQQLTQTTDRFNKTVMSDMMKAAMAFMKKEKDAQNQRFKAEKDHLDKIQQMNTKSTLSMNKVMTQLNNSLTIANNRLNASNIRSNQAIQLSAQESSQRQLLKTLTHKQAMESEEQHKLSVQSNIKLRHSLTGVTTSLSLFTGLLRNGATVGIVFGSTINNLNNALQRQKDLLDLNNTLKRKEAELITAKAVANPNQSQQDDIKSLEKAIIDLKNSINATTKGKGAGTAGVLGSKGMGFLSKIAEFASHHKTGIILGAAAAGTLLIVLKKAVDASPMFGQIVKLLDFGFRLVLRPIGDFFGFILKPIVILLLRKFIIPFYQRYLPQFQALGTKIGNFIASIDPATLAIAVGAVVGVAIAGALLAISVSISALCGCMKMGGLGGRGIGAIAIAGLVALVAKIKNGVKSIITFLTEIGTKIKAGLKSVTDFITNIGTKIKAGLKSFTDFITDMGTKIKAGLKSVTDFIGEIGTKIKSALKSFTDFITDMGTKIKAGVKSVTDFIGEIGTKMADGLKSFASKAVDFGKTAYETLKSTVTKILETGGKIAGSIVDAIGNTLKWIGDGMKSVGGTALKFFTRLSDYIGNKAQGLIDNIGKKLGVTGGSKVAGTVAKLGLKTATRAIPIVGWSLLAVDILGSVLKQFDPKAYEAINKGATSIGIPEWLLDFIGFGKESTFEQVKGMFEGLAESQTKNTKIEGHAHGGMITEPILGIGKSGKKYMFGERGNEFITPNSSRSSQNGNIVVNINIDKMSSNREDMNELRRVILNTMQDVNQKRGRI